LARSADGIEGLGARWRMSRRSGRRFADEDVRTQIGFIRSAHLSMTISGKPEIAR
jgi:hypothetical protein